MNIDKTDDWESRQDAQRQAQPPIVTNTPRAGESPEQSQMRTAEAREAYKAQTPVDLDEINRRKSLDPAPDPIDAARKRAAEFVSNIATNTKLELGRRRDELDNAMERITNSEVALTHYIGEFAKFNYEALEHAKALGKIVSELASPFKADPPATLTQLNSKKEG